MIPDSSAEPPRIDITEVKASPPVAELTSPA
jgi:hypothetical protein